MRRPKHQLAPRRAIRCGGFTLPELIVVMTIAAIIAATATPSIINLGTTRTTVAARQLVRDLTFARQRSISTGVRHWVALSVADQTWSVLAESPASPGRANATLLNNLVSGQRFVQELDSEPFVGVSITAISIGSESEIGFDWRGKPLASNESLLTSDATITFAGDRTVTVRAHTGFTSTP